MNKVLIIKPSSMGDVIHAFPAVHALLSAEPSWTVDWVIHPALAELLDYLPGIRRKILFRRQELGRFSSFFPAFRSLLREIRGERYDAVIDLQGLFRSALVGSLAKGGPLYGPASPRETPARFCYRKKLHVPRQHAHAVEKNCAMIREFSGSEEILPDYVFPVVEKYAKKKEKMLKEAGVTGRYIAIAPGARWETKQWPPDFFAACARLLAEKLPDRSFLLLGSPSEHQLGEMTVAAAKEVRLLNWCGRTSPGELTELIRGAELLLCNDSGPMHLAAAVGTPVAALFGPTDPVLTGPYSRNSRVIRPELECIGCFRKHCDTGACHQAVPPQTVVGKIMELLQEKEGKR